MWLDHEAGAEQMQSWMEIGQDTKWSIIHEVVTTKNNYFVLLQIALI